MTVVSPLFLLVALAAVLLLRVPRLRAWRADILTVLSLGFTLGLAAAPRDALCLIAMAASGWLLLRAVAASKSGWLLGLAILVIVGEFLLIRRLTPVIPWLPGVDLGRTIGLSYVMFRILHLLVDAQGDEMPGPLRLREYLCYLFFFPTFLAGPIQRLPDFAAELARPTGELIAAEHWPDLQRMVTGYFKFVVAAALFFAGFDWGTRDGAGALDAPHLAAAFVSFAAYLYVSFSGYTDIVRGLGGLLDFRLPENFDRPLLSANFLDLWSRWHISLSDWFKLYVFNPAAKAMIGAADRPSLVPYLGAAGYFLTFFLMGLWHGTSWRFALYGLCLGAGVSLNKLWQTAATARLGRRRYAALARQPLYVALSRSLAVGYFVLALGFFWLPAAPVAHFGAGAGAAALVLAVMLALGTAASWGETARRRALARPGIAAAVALAELACVVIYLLVVQGPVPPLLYRFF